MYCEMQHGCTRRSAARALQCNFFLYYSIYLGLNQKLRGEGLGAEGLDALEELLERNLLLAAVPRAEVDRRFEDAREAPLAE